MTEKKRVLPTLAAAIETAAAYQLTAEDVCPACGKSMKRTLASGIPSFVCLSDRVCLPARTTQAKGV